MLFADLSGGRPRWTEPEIPLSDQIACVKREIATRQRVYPRWVSEGKMPQAAADRETNTMLAVLATLERLQNLERGRF